MNANDDDSIIVEVKVENFKEYFEYLLFIITQKLIFSYLKKNLDEIKEDKKRLLT